MNSPERSQRLIAVAAICITLTSLLPVYFKNIFVEPSGKISLISPWFAALLVLALCYKKYWVRRVALVICSLLAVGLFVIFIGTMGRDHRSSATFLLFVLQIITILILRDPDVKNFLQG